MKRAKKFHIHERGKETSNSILLQEREELGHAAARRGILMGVFGYKKDS
jgi:hypothetical protein